MTRGACAILAMALAAGCGGGDGSSTSQAPANTPKGVLDTSFGSMGRVAMPENAFSITVARDNSTFIAMSDGVAKVDATGRMTSTSLAVVPFGRVATDASGRAYVPFSTYVFRFTPDGSADGSFGPSGMVLADTAGYLKGITSLVPAPDGSLYVVISDRDNIDDIFLTIVKLGSDGLPVAAFGNGGRLKFQPVPSTWPGGAVIDEAGNLYVSFRRGGTPNSMHVAKLDSTGRPVASFGNGGVWSGTRGICDAFGLAIDGSGSLYVPAECRPGYDVWGTETLVKLDRNGVAVQAFGDGGYLEGVFGTVPDKMYESMLQEVLVAGDGTLYVLGYAALGPQICGQRRLVALDSQGNRIKSFGTDGVMLDVKSAALDAAGRLYVLSGASPCPPSAPKGPTLLSRYL